MRTVTEEVPLGLPQPELVASVKGSMAAKPWVIPDPSDPKAEQPWYTPARYFARQMVKEDTTLLGKRNVLANKVSGRLKDVGIFKRGGKKPFDGSTVLKAFANVSLS